MLDERQLTWRKITLFHNFHCWIPEAAFDSGNSRREITSRKVFFSFLPSLRERGPENTYGFVELGCLSEEPSHKHSHTRALVFYVHACACDSICKGRLLPYLLVAVNVFLKG